MTELERKALLGDREAQKECTEKGIVLSCPFCGGESELKHTSMPTGFSEISDYFFVKCKECGCKPYVLNGTCLFFTDKGMEKAKQLSEKVLSLWNTRQAPPIGRCGECKNWESDGTFEIDDCGKSQNWGACLVTLHHVKENHYCSYFGSRCE